MIFTALEAVEGAYLVDIEPIADERGLFARVFCRDELAEHNLNPHVAQTNVSTNAERGTIRGLHWQLPPAGEAKLVRCTAGAVFDVVADVRPGSSTEGRWAGAELTAESHRMLYVPEECAHGYLALTDGAVVTYTASHPYAPELERGLRWDDPAFAIEWPDVGQLVVSDKDRAWPDYRRNAVAGGRS